MDFGLTNGNFITIPTPPNRTWETEEDVYFYLLFHDGASQEILDQANKKRCPTWGDIWVHHETFLCPFLLPPGISEDKVKYLLFHRLYSFMMTSNPCYLTNDN